MKATISALTATALTMASSVSAATLFTLNSFTPQSGSFFIGIEFNLTSTTQVNQLGVIDGNNDGILTGSTPVAIYSKAPGNSATTATYVTSAVVPAGTSPSSIGARSAFFTPIPTVTLPAGNYVIMSSTATSGESFGSNGGQNYTFLPGASYVNGWFTGSNITFQGVGVNIFLSNQAGSGSGWTTAVFDTAVAVPEPASFGLLGATALMLLGPRRRR
jgi:hypothetical protein